MVTQPRRSLPAKRVKRLVALGALSACALLLGCKRRNQQLEELNLTEDQAKRILAEISSHTAKSSAPEAPEAPATTDAGTNARERTMHQAVDPQLVTGDWVVDGLVDVGPAAPSSATKTGVVLINGENELFLARLGRLPSGPEPNETPITPLDGDNGRFALGRGPTVADGYAYWVTSHYLLRRPLKPPYGPLDILAADARVGTRTSALPGDPRRKRPTWVGYIALPTMKNGPLRAKLWYGQEHEAIISEPEASTLSVQLVMRNGQVHAVSLEARTGRSSLHIRAIQPGTPPALGADQVMWLGGAPHPMTELWVFDSPSAQRGADLLGLIPLEKDITHFGLATIRFPNLQSTEPSVDWIPYPNGINPAPVHTAEVCSKTVVLFARPSTASPGSPQELVLAELAGGRPANAVVLSRSKAFYDVSLASVRGGALVSYVGDKRTWARTVRCVPRRR